MPFDNIILKTLRVLERNHFKSFCLFSGRFIFNIKMYWMYPHLMKKVGQVKGINYMFTNNDCKIKNFHDIEKISSFFTKTHFIIIPKNFHQNKTHTSKTYISKTNILDALRFTHQIIPQEYFYNKYLQNLNIKDISDGQNFINIKRTIYNDYGGKMLARHESPIILLNSHVNLINKFEMIDGDMENVYVHVKNIHTKNTSPDGYYIHDDVKQIFPTITKNNILFKSLLEIISHKDFYNIIFSYLYNNETKIRVFLYFDVLHISDFLKILNEICKHNSIFICNPDYKPTICTKTGKVTLFGIYPIPEFSKIRYILKFNYEIVNKSLYIKNFSLSKYNNEKLITCKFNFISSYVYMTKYDIFDLSYSHNFLYKNSREYVDLLDNFFHLH